MRVVLCKEHLIVRRTPAIHPGIFPSVEEVPPFAVATAFVALRLLRRSDVIDHVKLMGDPKIQEDLVQLGVVIDAVAVKPFWNRVFQNAVDVQQLEVIGHKSIIFFGRISVLDEVVPKFPFPDNLAAGRASGLISTTLSGQTWALDIASGCLLASRASCLLRYFHARARTLPLGMGAMS